MRARRLAALALGLLISGCATPPAARPAPPRGPAPEGRAPRPSYFGLNGTKAFHIPEQRETVIAQRLAWLQELGVTWDRTDLWWHVVEPERGRFDFARSDLVLDLLEQHGVQWYPILCYGAAWFGGGRTAPLGDADFADFARYVAAVAERYRGRIPYYSLWNEPNIVNFWSPEPNVANYVRLLAAARPALRAADPAAQLCAPAIAPLGAWDRRFVERMYQLGAAPHFDVFDYHYYRGGPPEREVPRELAEIRAVMRRYGDGDKPIWISESGVTSLVEGQTGPDARQAAFVIRNHLLCLALGVERFFYFDLQNWHDDTPQQWDSQLGLVTAGGRKKASFDAYRTLVREVDRRDFIGRLTELGPQLEGVLLRDPHADEYTLAAWSTAHDLPDAGPPTLLTVVAAGPTATLVHPDGRTVRLAADAARTVSVALDAQPRYVRGVDPLVYLPDAGVQFDAPLTILAGGQTSPLRLARHPALENCRLLVSDSRGPDGILWDAERGAVTCAPGVAPGVLTLEAQVAVEYGPAGDRRTAQIRRWAALEVVPVLELTLRPVREPDSFSLRITIANQLAESVAGQLELGVDVDGGAQRRWPLGPVRVGAYATEQLAFPVPTELRDMLPAPQSWCVTFAGHRSRPVRLACGRWSQEPPTIDGDLAEWAEIPPLELSQADQVWQGAADWNALDAAARVRVWFTPGALHIGADIDDDDALHNPFPPLQLYRGDALELYLGVAGPTGRTVIDKRVEFQVALAGAHAPDGGPLAFWYHEDKLLPTAQVATRHRPGGYTLEAAIPLAALNLRDFRPEPGQLLAFDVTLDDRDKADSAPAGVEPGCRMTWNGGAANWINPSGYGLLVLEAR